MSMTPVGAPKRRGVALFAALSLLALLALLTVGAFAATTLSQRSERMQQADELLQASADYATTTVLSAPAQFGLAELPLGGPRNFTVAVPASDRVRATVSATRLAGGVLWLVADAELVGPETAHRRVGLLARFRGAGPVPPAPFVARGGILLGDSVHVSADTTGEPDCRVRGGFSATRQSGDSAAYFLTARQLAALDSMPGVRHVRGDTTIAGGASSGIMIIDGNVTVAGSFTVDGLLIARGKIVSAAPLTVRGALMAYSADASAIQIVSAQVEYSPCAMSRVFRVALAPTPVAARRWSDLF